LRLLSLILPFVGQVLECACWDMAGRRQKALRLEGHKTCMVPC